MKAWLPISEMPADLRAIVDRCRTDPAFKRAWEASWADVPRDVAAEEVARRDAEWAAYARSWPAFAAGGSS